MNGVDPRFLALREHPVALALRDACGPTACHLVGGALRDRLLGIEGSDLDAVVAGDGLVICERLAGLLPARLVLLGGRGFAAYRLVGDGFTLDVWDREGRELRDDLARRDFTINAFALDLADGSTLDPYDGLGDVERRRLRATTPGVFADDPLRVLRLVRLSVQLPGFRPDSATFRLAREAAPALAEVAAERVRDELGKILEAAELLPAFDQLAALGLYPGLLLGRPGEAGDAEPARQRLQALEPALEQLATRALPAPGRLDRAAARLTTLFAGLAGDEESAVAHLRRYRLDGYLSAAGAALCGRLLACRRAPATEAEACWFLHRWAADWPTSVAVLAPAAEPALSAAGWQELERWLSELAEERGAELFDPVPLLDGDEIQELLGIEPGPDVGTAVGRLRRAQVEGRVRSRAEAEELLRSPASDAG